jgi:hypothetical protein
LAILLVKDVATAHFNHGFDFGQFVAELQIGYIVRIDGTIAKT